MLLTESQDAARLLTRLICEGTPAGQTAWRVSSAGALNAGNILALYVRRVGNEATLRSDVLDDIQDSVYKREVAGLVFTLLVHPPIWCAFSE